MTNIVLLAITVTTNQVPGFYSGTQLKLGDTSVNAIAVWNPPKTVVSTNYHLGFWNGTNPVTIATITAY